MAGRKSIRGLTKSYRQSMSPQAYAFQKMQLKIAHTTLTFSNEVDLQVP